MAVRFVLLLCLQLPAFLLFAQRDYPMLLDITSRVSEDAYSRILFVRPETRHDRKVADLTGDFYAWMDTAANAPFVSANLQASEIVELLMSKRPKELALMTALLDYHEPVLRDLLKREKLAESWMYLPLIVSGGVTENSWKGGAGPWHLYYPHARKFGLLVSPKIDERLDFEKSALAATAVLRQLKAKLKSDSLALMEYACGPAFNSLSDSVLAAWCQSLPAQMLALDYIFSNRKRLGIATKNAVPVPVDRQVMRKEAELAIVARVMDLDEKKLLAINETILTGVVPENYGINLPAKMKEKFHLLEDSIYSAQVLAIQPVFESPKVIVYIVRSGDTLSEIAQKHRVSLSRLRTANKMRGDMIYAGQKLVIPND